MALTAEIEAVEGPGTHAAAFAVEEADTRPAVAAEPRLQHRLVRREIHGLGSGAIEPLRRQQDVDTVGDGMAQVRPAEAIGNKALKFRCHLI